MEEQKEVLDQLLSTWAASRSDEVVFNPSSGYYSFDIVTDAYLKGLERGTQEGYDKGKQKSVDEYVINEYRKLFFKKANLVSEALTETLAMLKKHNFSASKLFINHSIQGSKILLAIDIKTHHSEDFIKFAYNEAAKIEDVFYTKELNIHIGFINDVSDLNLQLIRDDGFDVGYDLKNNTEIN